MARPRKNSTKKTKQTPKKPVYTLPSNKYLTKIETDIKNNPSRVSMILGGLIILVIGILVFNFFNKSKPSLGPAQQTESSTAQQKDVAPQDLPGKYTVKEGDTLFLIAEKYYKDGDKFSEIAKANNLTDVNAITVGQTLNLPKLSDNTQIAAKPSNTPTPSVSPTPAEDSNISSAPQGEPENQDNSDLGTGGGNNTIWGPRIEGATYTVQEGDWLSTIAGRSYGDVLSYKKIAEANNISNPDYIVPGQVLKIPR